MKELESQKKGLARQQTSNLDAKQLKRGSTKAGIFRSMTSNVSADKTDGSGGAKKEMSREKTDDSSSSSSSSDDSHAERERERQREAAARRGSIRRNSAEHILGSQRKSMHGGGHTSRVSVMYRLISHHTTFIQPFITHHKINQNFDVFSK